MSTGWAYYAEDHPFCEIRGCSTFAFGPQTHHIVARGRKGTEDNRRANLIRLCTPHHTECHSMGRKRFPEKYGLEARWSRAFESQGDLT